MLELKLPNNKRGITLMDTPYSREYVKIDPGTTAIDAVQGVGSAKWENQRSVEVC